MKGDPVKCIATVLDYNINKNIDILEITEKVKLPLLVPDKLYFLAEDLTNTFPSVKIYIGGIKCIYPVECFVLPTAIDVAKWKLNEGSRKSS